MEKLTIFDGVRTHHLNVRQINLVRYLSFTRVERSWVRDALLDDKCITADDIIEFIYHLGLETDKEVDRSNTSIPKGVGMAQSDAVEDVGTTDTTKEVEQNVQFADAEQQIDLKVGMMTADPTFLQGFQENAQLSDFLMRPIEVFRREWTVGAATPFVDVFNPWALFLGDARVLNKLETFKLLHGTLKLKFLINGSPYHYGRVFVGCRPTRYDNNTSTVDLSTGFLTTNYQDNSGVPGPKTMIVGRTFYSQRPHIFIDPATNQPSHIDWPFFAATNYIDLQDSETIDRMGRIEMWELNTLQHNNSATDPLTITVFAWMEDVTLTGLTSTAVAQSDMVVTGAKKKKGGKKKSPPIKESRNTDEYQNDGMISGPASAVASYAAYFTEIPVIGKFARATHIAAGAAADVARLFGFSRPPIISDPLIQRPMTVANMATFSGGDTLFKLALDPKQELTIDPQTAGLPSDDQMAIGYVAKKEAWIDSFVWNNGQFADRRIYSIAVHPMVAPVVDLTPADAYMQTPLSFVTLPFNQWRGSLKYRFQIVASAFHRGRLAVVYEPSLVPELNINLNNRYVAILDLAEAKDFTIEVKWSQAQAYCNVEYGLNQTVTSSDYPSFLTGIPAFNGILNVYVINELASSITTSSVDVNVYISAGDDYQVQMPRERLVQLGYARNDTTVGPPALAQSEVITDQENDPNQNTSMVINGSYCGCDPQSNLVFFGEQITSIRSYMKRYHFHRVMTVDGLNADEVYSVAFSQFTMPTGPGPTYASSIASPITPIAGPANYNVCAMTAIRYFMQAYIGWRGSIRWKVVFIKGQGDSGVIKAVRRTFRGTVERVETAVLRGAGQTVLTTAQRYLLDEPHHDFNLGGNLNSALVNPTIEYEVPMYHAFRYVETNEPPIGNAVDNLKYQGNYNGGLHYVATVSRNADTDSFGMLECYNAIGEDFSLFFFIGAPPVYFNDAGSVT
jgi:hypothetical protein